MKSTTFAIALILTITAGLAGTNPVAAAVLNVPGDYSLINDAVQACAAGDTVLVAAGTYYDCTHPTEGAGSIPACVIMKSGVTLRGAGPDATIIDAQTLGRGIFIELVDNCRVENLQVTNAYAAIYGAGLLIRNVAASVEVTDVRVTACTDGGVICITNSSPTLRRVTMDNNSAKQGGGLAIEESSSPLVIDCVIDRNQAPSGAGIFMRNNCAPVISGSLIANNSITASNTYGGGIAVQSSTPTITNCTIEGNTANGFGGGIAFTDASSGLLEDCLIQGNDNTNTNGQGGGVFASQSDPVFRRLVIAGNSASGFFGKGGGVHISFNPAPTLENCTIVENSCGSSGSGGGLAIEWFATPALDKCIVANSAVGEAIFCDNATPTVSCSDIFGNAGGDALCGTDGGGNFSADPLFCGIPGAAGTNAGLALFPAAGAAWGLADASPCAPGNHPDGLCAGALIGALGTGLCQTSAADLPPAADLVLGNQPNPFNPRTTIFFELTTPGPATLSIYNLAGQLLQQRTWPDLPRGRHEFIWTGLDRQGRTQGSGVYLYRLETRDQSRSRRMSLIR